MAAYGVDIEIGVKGQQQLQNLTREIKQAGRAADLIADSLGKKGKVSQSIDNYNSALRRASKTLGTVIAGTRAETRAVKQYAEALSDVIAIEQRRERLVKGAFRETPAGQAELELKKARKSLETQREAAKFRKDVAISEAEYYKASLESAARSNQRVNDQINLQERLNGALRQGAFEARMLSENMKQPQRMVGPVYGLRADQFTAASAAKATERLAIQQKITRLSASQVFQKNLEFALATKLLGKDKQRNLLAEQITARQKEMIRDGQALAAQKERALAAEKKSADLAAVQRKRGVGGAISSGLIGGGFPLLFGQGGAAAAGGALGGLAGGALGGGFGFALSVIGTAVGQAISDIEDFDQQLSTLNATLTISGDTAITTADDVKSLANELGIAKEEAIELIGSFSQFRDSGLREELARVFGSVGGFKTFETIVKARLGEEQALESIQSLENLIGIKTANRLRTQLDVNGALSTSAALQQAVLELSQETTKENEKNVKFMDRINSLFANLGMMSAMRAGVTLEGPVKPAEFGEQRAEDIAAPDTGLIDRALALREQFLRGVEEQNERFGKNRGAIGANATVNLQKRLNILNKQISSEEKFVGVSTQGTAIIKRKLALESKIAQIQETGKAERKRLTDQEDIALSKSIETKAIKLENLKFEREATALIERQNKAGEKLLEPLQKKLNAIKDRNAFEKEYGDLIMSGSTPAAAKQVIEAQKQIKEIERLVEKQLESNEILIENLRIKVAETEGTKAHAAAVDALNKALERRNEIEEKGRIAKGEVKGEKTSAERFNDEIKAIQGIINELNDPVRQAIELSRTLGSAFSESFKGIVSGSMSAQQALANLFQRTADHFLDMAAQMIAAQIRMQAVKLFMNFIPGLGGGTAGLSDLNAPASINNPLGIMPERALGGPVSRNQPYLVGERGPEMFVPGAQGNIVPNNAMGGGANVTVNVDASGSSVEGDGNQAAQLGKAIGIAVQQELIKQKRPGGLLTR